MNPSHTGVYPETVLTAKEYEEGDIRFICGYPSGALSSAILDRETGKELSPLFLAKPDPASRDFIHKLFP